MPKLQVRRNQLIVAIVLALLTLAIYWQVINFGFISIDDPSYITENGSIHNGLTPASIIWAFTAKSCSNWHPLTWISHMLDCQFFGTDAGGHHIVNVLLHIANTLLLLFLLIRMTGSLWRSAFVAALFALHPVHVESVAWVSERKDVLSTFFWMLTMLGYAWYAKRPGIGRYLVTLLAFVLGLLSKPMLVSLPFVLLMLDYWPLDRAKLGWKRLIVEKIPFAALAAASSAITIVAQRTGGAMRYAEELDFGIKLSNALVSYMHYIEKMLYPANLYMLYPHPGSTLPVWEIILAVALLAGLTVLALRLAKTAPYAAVGWLWFILTLIPVIGLVQVGTQAMADRYTYVPYIGLFIVIAWGVPELLARLITGDSARRSALVTVSLLIIAGLSAGTYIQLGHWRTDNELMNWGLKVTKGHPLIRIIAAKALAREDKIDEAATMLQESPEVKAYQPALHNSLGMVYKRQGKLREAGQEYMQAIRLNPNYAEPYTNLGVLMADRGLVKQAAALCTRAVELDPYYVEGHCNLAVMKSRLGKPDEAINEYETALKINPDFAYAHTCLGMMLLDKGDPDGALVHLGKALEFTPDSPSTLLYMGAALSKKDRMDESMLYILKAIKLKPDWGMAHDYLAMALFVKERYPDAWKAVHKAQSLGFNPSPAFLRELTQKMPEPK